ncbi:MAG: outer membrane beta-barrel protein [Stappiaceae bacterium]
MRFPLRALLLAGVAGLTATQSAHAFEGVIPGAAKLTSQTSVYDWTGFYLGVGGGTGYILDEVTIPTLGGSSISGVGGRGFFGKLTAGYDHAFSNGFVVGGAIAARYGDIDTSWTVPGVGFTADIEADYGVDVTARVGYEITPRTIAYLLGGYSYQHFELNSSVAGASTDWHDNGYILGLGVESAIRQNWTWSGEYRFAKYSGESIGAFGGASIDPVIHSFHSSLNYRFGGGPSQRSRDPFVYDWTGFKIGGAISAGISVSDVSSGNGGSTFDGLATEGFLGEVSVGYDYEFHNRWVAGVQLAAQYIESSASATTAGVTISAEADDFGFDALARIGYKFNDYTLGYVIGGYSWQNMSASISTPAISEDVGVSGFSIGTGSEFALSEKLTSFIEYRYTQYEDVDLGSVASLEPVSHTVRVGAKFKLY